MNERINDQLYFADIRRAPRPSRVYSQSKTTSQRRPTQYSNRDPKLQKKRPPSYNNYKPPKRSVYKKFGAGIFVLMIPILGVYGLFTFLNQSSINNNSNEGPISLYSDTNYKGNKIILDIGNYPDITDVGLANDALSSIKIADGLQVILYQDYNYGGPSWILNNDNNDLTSIGANDKASSIKINGGVPPTPNPSQGRESYDGPWGGKHVELRDVWEENWFEGLSSREKYLLVTNNDCSQNSVKDRALTNGYSVLAQEGDNDSGATLLEVQGNSKIDGLKAILDVGKITITAVTTDATLIHDGGGAQDGEDPKRQAFGSTDNTNTGGGVYHLDINANEDGVTIWDKDHPCEHFRGGFMYLRWG